MLLDYLKLYPQAFGLDISELSIKIAKLEKRRKGIHLSSFAEVGLAEGVIVGGQIQDEKELIKRGKEAIQAIQGEALKTSYVVASLPEERAFLQVVQLPVMQEEEIEHAIRFEAENYIPYPIETVYIDSQIVTPYRNHLDHLDVLLGALPRDTVDSYVNVIQKMGFIPQVLEIESLAVTRALMPSHAAPYPVMIIDLGASRTNLIIFSGYTVRFTTSVPVASAAFSKAIQEGLGVSSAAAEEAKKKYGIAKKQDSQGEKVSEILNKPIKELLIQTKKYLDYYESHPSHQHLGKDKPAIKKIILCGGGSNLPGLVEFLASELKMEVMLGNPWENILSSTPKNIPPLSFSDSIRFTTALGLALRGMQ